MIGAQIFYILKDNYVLYHLKIVNLQNENE